MNNLLPLKVDDLSLRIGSHSIFERVSFEVARHQFVTLMGENGVGKTSLIETLLCVRKASLGDVFFWGKQFQDHQHQDLFARVGYVSSTKEQYPLGITVGELLTTLARIYPSWNGALAAQLVQDFQLEKNKKLSHLSLGEHSKVRLIKAIAFEPELLILDELTANLSPASKSAVQKVLIDIFSRTQMSVLYVCHSQEEALRLSDRILTLTPNGIIIDGVSYVD